MKRDTHQQSLPSGVLGTCSACIAQVAWHAKESRPSCGADCSLNAYELLDDQLVMLVVTMESWDKIRRAFSLFTSTPRRPRAGV